MTNGVFKQVLELILFYLKSCPFNDRLNQFPALNYELKINFIKFLNHLKLDR